MAFTFKSGEPLFPKPRFHSVPRFQDENHGPYLRTSPRVLWLLRQPSFVRGIREHWATGWMWIMSAPTNPIKALDMMGQNKTGEMGCALLLDCPIPPQMKPKPTQQSAFLSKNVPDLESPPIPMSVSPGSSSKWSRTLAARRSS